MKKHILVSSVLLTSLVSNCMEKEHTIAITSPDKQSSVIIKANGNRCETIILHVEKHNTESQNSCIKTSPSAQLNSRTQFNAKIQEKMSLAPKTIFSLNDEEVEKLRASLTQKNHILSNKTALFNALNNPQTSKEKKQSIIENLIHLEHQDINLDEQLNIHLTPEDQQLSDDLNKQIGQIASKVNMSDEKTSSINEFITDTISVIDQLIPLYLKTETIQNFIENVLMKCESGELFIPIKEKCQNHISDLTKVINNLTMGINHLTEASQAQTSSKK